MHLFHEYTDRDFIEKTVGAPVIQSNFYDSKASLLVFEDHGKPVKANGVSGDYLRAKDNQVTWGADVVLKPWGDGFLILAPPDTARTLRTSPFTPPSTAVTSAARRQTTPHR